MAIFLPIVKEFGTGGDLLIGFLIAKPSRPLGGDGQDLLASSQSILLSLAVDPEGSDSWRWL